MLGCGPTLPPGNATRWRPAEVIRPASAASLARSVPCSRRKPRARRSGCPSHSQPPREKGNTLMIKLSYVIVTHQRREPLLRTLDVLARTTPLPRSQWETWVVDNGSTDGTVEAVRSRYPEVQLIRRPGNEGVWARSYAFGPARGEYLI